MTPTQYQERAARTINKKNNILEQRQHALFGMASEVGEIHGIFQKQYQGHNIDYVELQKELGDLLWFIAEFCTANGWYMEDIMQMNLDKLEAKELEVKELKREIESLEHDIALMRQKLYKKKKLKD